ncbi:MAG: DNA polymerase III subunit alpha, partial [Dehalococcoidales bacterium]|nr:DNA polymerase III subunit alpha [Dehalococcoidales bacterium]
RLGISVLPPDINRSKANFSIEKQVDGTQAIRFGLNAIKNVGLGAVEPIMAERDRSGEYRSIEDFCRRADLSGVNKRVMESLVKAGAMDTLGDRGTLLGNTGRILSLSQREQRLRQTGQSTMFDLWGETVSVPLPSLDMVAGEVSKRERLGWEKELLGVYLSEHPFSPYVSKAASENTTLCGQVDAEMEGQVVTVAGMVASVRQLLTRDGQPSASVMLEDLDGRLEVMAWPRVYAAKKELLQEGNVLLVEGRVKLRGDRVQLVCEKIDRYPLGAEAGSGPLLQREDVPPTALESQADTETAGARRLVINLSQTGDEAGDVARLRKVIDTLKCFPGEDEVSLMVDDGKKVFNLKLPGLRVGHDQALKQRLVELVGEERVRLEAGD